MIFTAIAGIAGGAFLGGIVRILLRSCNPYAGTLAANMLACFCLGASYHLGPWWSLSIGAGCAATMSTWSTLAAEIGSELHAGRRTRAAAYALVSLVCGVGMVKLGLALVPAF